MNVLMVRAKIKEENVVEAKAPLEQSQPAGVQYASCLLSTASPSSPC